MKNKILIPILAAVMLFTSGCSADGILSGKDVENLLDEEEETESPTDFNDALFAILDNENKGKSFIFSPYSIKDCITITYDGLSDDAKKELGTLGVDRDDIKSITDLDGICKKAKNISIADKAYYSKQSKDIINTDLLRKDSEGYYDNKDTKGSAKKINRWVEKTTHGKITDLISPENITDSSAMILLNAIYMKSKWKNEDSYNDIVGGLRWMPESNEKNGTYKGFDGNIALSDTKKIDDATIFRLPYEYEKGLDLYMYVILPDDDEDKNAIDDLMTDGSNDIQKLLDFTDNKGPVDDYDDAYFKLPDFEMRYKASIKDNLESIGLDKKFMGEDAYRKLSKDPDISFKVSDILHEAYIKTDIKGTEAAAATAEMMDEVSTALPAEEHKPTLYAICDHPFFFAIKDDNSGQVLFMGKVTEDSLTAYGN